jgi:hypothetical protein
MGVGVAVFGTTEPDVGYNDQVEFKRIHSGRFRANFPLSNL